jgi:Acetyltransferase (GNAT) family
VRVVLHGWWRGDSLPSLDRPKGFIAVPWDDFDLLAGLAKLEIGQVLARVRTGSQPYVALLDGAPAGYGWSARAKASIGEVGLSFDVPHGQRYLWDFATLLEWRGRGVYPALLQAILAAEGVQASRFWIGHVATNIASRNGIRRAGFGAVGALEWSGSGVGLVPIAETLRANAAALVTGVSLVAAGGGRPVRGLVRHADRPQAKRLFPRGGSVRRADVRGGPRGKGTELAAVCAREAADPQPAADDAAHTDLATAAVGRLLAGGGQGVVGVLQWLDGR